MLNIKNLSVSVEDRKILEDINIEVDEGDIVAILGPNGHGKSTILKSIFNHYSINKDNGEIYFNNININNLEPNDISKLGIFLTPQISEEIPGVNMIDFLKLMINSHRENPISIVELFSLTEKYIKELDLNRDILKRHINLGFSGGEKKKSEILQMLLINPKLLLLDEIDSGLDVDSLDLICKKILDWFSEEKKSIVLVSHNEKIFTKLKPNKVIVLLEGKIRAIGGFELIEKVNTNGYGWLKNENI